jgi:transposase
VTALRAASLRSSAVIEAARAFPPFNPPLRPRDTAAGFFRFFMPEIYVSAHAKTSCFIRERSRIILLMMNTREAKALEIADKFRIVESSGKWIVPSQNSSKKYAVRVVGKSGDCTCPDFETRREACKHMLAVRYLIQREENADGSTTITETFEIAKRTTYPQQWTAYNTAQVNEKDYFQAMLHGLCSGIQTPIQSGKGQRRLPLADMVFAATFKVYSTVSGRRFMSDLRESKERGYIDSTPHYNSIFGYLENPDLKPILTNLIELSAMPLQSVERDFAADSTGFSTGRFERWYDHKYGRESFQREWVKVHIMCGTKTNVVTAVKVLDKESSDSPQLPDLLETTQQAFDVAEVSADKGYLSYANTRKVADSGATPFIAFKKNSHSGDCRKEGVAKTQAWSQMYHYFMFRREEFLEHYHKRSNVESTFSMMKRKFGDSLRSKTDVAMVNEALCKVLCHNIVVLIHEMFELGIDPVFLDRQVSSV